MNSKLLLTSTSLSADAACNKFEEIVRDDNRINDSVAIIITVIEPRPVYCYDDVEV